MIKVICFDLDGLYFHKAHSNYAKNVARRFSLSESLVRETLFVRAAEEGGYEDLKKGKISSDRYWDWLLKVLNLEGRAKKEDFLEELIKGYQVNPRVKRLIKKIRGQGILSAVCSNNYRDNIENLDKRFNFLSDFDMAVFSYEVGVLKPGKRIFEELIKRSRVKPEEIVYSDDDPEKIQGAEELGIKTFVYQDFDQFCRELEKLGVKV